ncbi:hypothetical protein BMS3Bbin14_00303 [bacterium BMS3Bbin14]|nr:hypothetical protein BMS3Bbin14_00303 [bacterium BMS3Bbin14]HDO29478.1 DUF3696 domain-containing protein [Desulfobacteraceae bacterium]
MCPRFVRFALRGVLPVPEEGETDKDGVQVNGYENFKGIQEPVRVELKPITLLFGPNSAGKSTIFQALHYAREIFQRQNLNPDRTLLGGDTIDLGGFENLVHRHDLKLPIRIMLDIDLSREDLPNHDESQFIGDRDTPGNVGLKMSEVPSRINTMQVEVAVRWSERLETPYIEMYRVNVNSHFFLFIKSSPDGKGLSFDINPYNPVFLPEDVTPEEAEEALFQVYESDDDEPQFKVGVLCWAWFELTEGFDGSGLYSVDISGGLDSALPAEHAAISFNFPEKEFPVGNSKDEKEKLRVVEEREAFADFTYNLSLLLGSLIAGPCACVREGLRNFCYLGPLREVPRRSNRPATSPEDSRWANGLAAYDTLFFSDDAFIDRVNEWLTREERLNSGYSVDVKKYRELETDNPLMLAVLQGRILDEDIDLSESLLALPVKRRLLIRDEARDIELAPQDIGVGISQVLPVVVAALHRKTGLVAIEQPELHIHPAFQVALGDLFIEQVRKCPDLTFILETHSEHLMLRFLRRIRETGENEAPKDRTLTPDELSIYFIEQGEAGISCFSIRVDEDGDFIDRWPKGFFAERAGELF